MRARFFGLAAERATPNPSDLPTLNWSIVCIHFGISGSIPALGRLRHCPAAITRNSTPISSLITSTAVDEPESVSSEPLATSTTTTLTTTSPTTQPTANAEPFDLARGVPSIRMTAMIGTGLIATPTADGSRSPIA